MLRTLAGLRRQIGPDAGLRGGPDGALYSAELFESHVGEVTAFIPLSASAGGSWHLALDAGTHRWRRRSRSA